MSVSFNKLVLVQDEFKALWTPFLQSMSLCWQQVHYVPLVSRHVVLYYHSCEWMPNEVSILHVWYVSFRTLEKSA